MDGNITDESSNFLRDTVFFGNQEAYDAFGFVVMMAASLVVPLGGAANAAIAVGSSVGRALIVALGKVVVTAIVSTAAGSLAGYGAGLLWGPEVGAIVGTVVAVVVAVVVAGGLEKLDRANNWSGFHQASATTTFPNNLDDFLDNPDALKDLTPEEFFQYLKDNGYDPQPLSRGSLAGRTFENGGGFKVNWGGNRIIQYHPGGGYHSGAYWKISSAGTGIIKVPLDGNYIF